MSYALTLSKHRRLTILRFLADSPEYTSNGSILLQICNQFGVTSTHDQVAGDLAWLKDQGMVTYTETVGVVVVEATQHGVDIAAGRARHDGVQRPSADI